MRNPLRLIDVPTSLTSTEPYEKFLEEMKYLPQDDPRVKRAINQAKEEIKRVRAFLKRRPEFKTAPSDSAPARRK